MDDVDYMCAFAVHAMDEAEIGPQELMLARQVASEALLDFVADEITKGYALAQAVDEYFSGLF